MYGGSWCAYEVQSSYYWSSIVVTISREVLLLGGCFVAEDPKEREHLRQILSEAAPKLSPIKLRHSDRSQDEGVNRLKDEMT
jgi:hypothetical protein